MKKLFVLPMVLLALNFPVNANESAIDEMFRVMSMDKQMDGGFEAMLPVVDQMSARFNLNQAGKEELRTVFRTWFDEDIDRTKIIKEIKALYSQSFTDSEIREITQFYKTDVGKKFLEKSPQLMQLGAQIGMKEAQVKQAQLMQRVQPVLEKHGVKS